MRRVDLARRDRQIVQHDPTVMTIVRGLRGGDGPRSKGQLVPTESQKKGSKRRMGSSRRLVGVPDGIRTRVIAVKGRCPRPG